MRAIVTVIGKDRVGITASVCGLLADEDGDAVAEKLRTFIAEMAKRGCTIPSPNITLSFITLIFIPQLAITDQGLFDVGTFQIIDPIISLK